MRRANRRQLSLSLGLTEIPETQLRAAFERCRLNLSFEDAMQQPMYQKCIRNVVISTALKGGRR